MQAPNGQALANMNVALKCLISVPPSSFQISFHFSTYCQGLSGEHSLDLLSIRFLRHGY